MDNIFNFIAEQWLLVTVLLVLLNLYIWSEKRKGGDALSIHSATRAINSGSAVVVDLRDAKEFKQGHIVDAINIPHSALNDKLSELEAYRDKTLLLVDKLGQHSGNAGRILKSKGFQVSRLGGGIGEWESQNLPLVKS